MIYNGWMKLNNKILLLLFLGAICAYVSVQIWFKKKRSNKEILNALNSELFGWQKKF